MTKPKILVTGATGKTGYALVEQLRMHDWPVRAVASRIDERSEALQQLGAEVVVADMYDPEQMYQAVRGMQRAYYLPLMRPYMIQAANAFAVAARDAGLEHVVQMSQWTSSSNHPTPMTRQTWLIDRVFSMIPGVAHTIFNPGMFADNFLRTIDFAALLGIYPVLMGTSKSAPISNEDMARCAATLLMQGPEKHAGRSYHPTGPQLLDGREMAGIVAGVVGHKVVAVDLPLVMFRKVARMQRIDPYQIALLVRYVEDNKQGTFSFEGGVTDVMRELTGKPAETFATTASRYARLPFAKQTIGNRLRALWNFAITPFYPAYDLDGYLRKLHVPVPAQTMHCMQDPQWRDLHSVQMHMSDAPSRKVITVPTEALPHSHAFRRPNKGETDAGS